jgi:hypothetical protein
MKLCPLQEMDATRDYHKISQIHKYKYDIFSHMQDLMHKYKFKKQMKRHEPKWKYLGVIAVRKRNKGY